MIRKIAIVGAGFSGSVLAARLLRNRETPVDVSLFEQSGDFCSGLAYATSEPSHLLNVPASRMSALVEEPDHFVKWLRRHGDLGPFEPDKTFVPRSLYRRYLQDLLTEAEQSPGHPQSRLRRIAAYVSAIQPEILTREGDRFSADEVVLTTGYLPESKLRLPHSFQPFAPETWPKGEISRVAIVGTGLTAMDAALTVFDRYPGVTVTAVSTRGHLPAWFDPDAPHVELGDVPPDVDLRGLTNWVRREIARVGNWQSVFHVLRSEWEPMWQSLTVQDQARFLRHVWRIFERFRHRLPPPTADRIESYIQSGRLEVRARSVRSVSKHEGVVLETTSRDTITADMVIDCTGPSLNWASTNDPLMRKLLADEFLMPGPHGMGVAMSSPSPNIHLIGAMLKGQKLETTAVGELRKQVAQVAEKILSSC